MQPIVKRGTKKKPIITNICCTICYLSTTNIKYKVFRMILNIEYFLLRQAQYPKIHTNNTVFRV